MSRSTSPNLAAANTVRSRHEAARFAPGGFFSGRLGCRERREDRCGAGGGKEDEGAEIEVLELGYEDALDKLARGEIVDVKTVVLLQYLQLHIMNEDPAQG